MKSYIIYGDNADEYYDRTIHFLDSAFMRKRAEDIDSLGRKVGLMQFMSCGGVYPFLDCMSVDNAFWLVHFEDGEDYMMYYGRNDVILLPVAKYKAEMIKIINRNKKE